MRDTQQRLVWDLPLRIFHWLLVVSVAGSWATGKIGSSVREYHMWLGYWMLGLLTFRLLWGLFGTKHSRFSTFVPTPKSVVHYARDVLTGRASQSIGHNPLGSLMIFLMLGLLVTQAVSGLFVDDDVFFAGPFAHAVSSKTGKFFEGLHHDVVDWIVVLSILHIVAALYHTFKLKDPIVRAMFTGKKNASVVSADEAIPHSAIARAVVIAMLTTGFVYWLVVIAPPPLLINF